MIQERSGGGERIIGRSGHTQSRTMRVGSERAASKSFFLDLENRLLVTGHAVKGGDIVGGPTR